MIQYLLCSIIGICWFRIVHEDGPPSLFSMYDERHMYASTLMDLILFFMIFKTVVQDFTEVKKHISYTKDNTIE
jgi:hypothetical protein